MIKRALFATFIVSLFSISAHAREERDSVHTINEVVVTGTRNETDIRHLPMTISVVGNGQIRSRYEPSLLPILTEQVPGLFVTSRGVMGYGVSGGGAGGMKVRGVGGSPTSGMLVLIDGHPQYMGLMGHPVSDSYQSMLAERVEVLRGPASVLYGSNAMGGVINIVTNELKTDGRRTDVRLGYGSYNTLQTEALNSYRKGGLSNVSALSYNRTDGHRERMGFEQLSGYTKLGYDFGDAWRAFADLNLSHFNASNPGSTASPLLDNDSRITRGMASMSVENTYDNTSGAFKFFYNWGRHKIDDGYSPGAPPRDFRFNSKDLMMGINLYQSVSLFGGNRITAGVDYQYFGGKAWNKFDDGRSADIVDKAENEVAGYISIRQNIGGILTFDAGVRLDHHSQSGTMWVPQGGLALQLPRSAELRAMVSRGFRNPTIREMYMFPPQNPYLMPERTMNYELSYSQRALNNDLSYGVNVFYIDGDNMIDRRVIDGRPLNINIDKIENWGAEANANYRVNSAWSLSTNYSWLHMEHTVVAAPEHKLYAGVDFRDGKWSASSGVQYINGLYTDVESAHGTKENFVLWNVRGSYRLHQTTTLFLKGENLLAQRYEINAGYPMPRATIMGGVNLNF